MSEWLRRWSVVVAVGFALVVAGVAAAGPGLQGGPRPPRPPEPPLVVVGESHSPLPPEPPPRAAREIVHTDYPGWITWPLTFLILAVAVGVVGLFLYAGARFLLTERVVRRELITRRASQPGGALPVTEVRDVLRAGLADLDAGGDPRRAVIACWLRLERIAATAGSGRLAADTPADLVARLLAAHQVSDAALGQLAEAYRLARYAPDEVGQELLATARSALAAVADQLHSGAARSGTARR